MYINSEPTIAMPPAHRLLDTKSAVIAKSSNQPAEATACGLTRAELRKIVIDLIG